jgi:hypothetical protein
LPHFGGDLNETTQSFEENYCGGFDSLAAWAEEFWSDVHGAELKSLPTLITYHIDWAAIGEDLEMGGDIFTIQCGGLVHVFHA